MPSSDFCQLLPILTTNVTYCEMRGIIYAEISSLKRPSKVTAKDGKVAPRRWIIDMETISLRKVEIKKSECSLSDKNGQPIALLSLEKLLGVSWSNLCFLTKEEVENFRWKNHDILETTLLLFEAKGEWTEYSSKTLMHLPASAGTHILSRDEIHVAVVTKKCHYSHRILAGEYLWLPYEDRGDNICIQVAEPSK